MRLSPENPMGRVLAITLALQAVVFGLALPGLVAVAGVAPLPATAAAGGALVLAVAGAATLRRAVGYPLGWAAQLAGVGMGLLTPWMYAVGGMFLLLWTITFILGKRLEAR